MKRAAWQWTWERLASVCPVCTLPSRHTPNRSDAIQVTLQDLLGGWRKLLMKCLNIFINNSNKNIPHFQSCFSLVLNTVWNSPLDGYYFRLSSDVRRPLYHIYDQMTSFVLAVSYRKEKEVNMITEVPDLGHPGTLCFGIHHSEVSLSNKAPSQGVS